MKKQKKFPIIEIIWLFIVGSFLGFLLETVWHYLKYGTIINKQGLLYGPFKPIYGFGLIIVIISMVKFKNKNILMQFSMGVLIGSAFEYISSLFQEYIFGTSTWDYANFNYNIGGRIYLPYSLAWGVIALICLYFIYPFVKWTLEKTPLKIKKLLTIIVSIFMAFNIIMTVLATVGYAKRANNISKSGTVFKAIDELYPDTYMRQKFPGLKIIKK